MFYCEQTGEHYTYTSCQQKRHNHANDDDAADCDSPHVVQAAAHERVTEAQVAALFDESSCQTDLSNSSLRRKLFFHGDEGTPLSPVRWALAVYVCVGSFLS